MGTEILRMENITKIYSNGFAANKNVTFSVNAGEIHALAGENGAGKTTLMKILFGRESYQEGRILLRGQEVHIKDSLDAIGMGIGMVHQHFMQMPSLTVAENVILGIEPTKKGGVIFDQKKARQMTMEAAEKYQLHVDPDAKIKDLSVGMRQKVEILKELIRGIEILILDEPTAVLTPQETKELFDQLRFLRDQGYAIIFISHKLGEVMELCSRVTVLRRGRIMGTDLISNLDQSSLARMIVGRDVVTKMERGAQRPKHKVVEVKDLVYQIQEGRPVVNHLNFSIRAGEILGIAGVEGNGQSEVADLLCGMRPISHGNVCVNGTSINGLSVRKIRELGVSAISEDRLKFACAENLSVRDNIMSIYLNSKAFTKGMLLDMKKVNQYVAQCIQDYEIKCDSPDDPVRLLSGGNIQKVVVAREFTCGSNLIIASQPTRGIDVGTSEMIRKTLIRKARQEDVATLLISSDLNEVLEVSDRLLVMYKGQFVAHFTKPSEVSEELLGEYMLGNRHMSEKEMGEYV